IALPGDYTLKLTVEGFTMTAPLKLVPDPRLSAPAATTARFTLLADAKEVEDVKKILTKVPALKFHSEGETGFLPIGLDEQHKFVVAVRDDITALTTTVTHTRSIKKQLGERAEALKDEQSAKALLDTNKKLVAKLD